ncbi:hypothetical protein SBF1_50084 [Candidatus Desulfosporosinus infrequens]|uniref:Uncharacterized protein n=1 Tax=Candidatus Desulfosporosinus infrequens TaxID=2043169 RepID=A0A2U3LH89_9FIRM|nr:hypothetical protein SBF1_50084 [Candidatus Desulfosporosinus infrequens]
MRGLTNNQVLSIVNLSERVPSLFIYSSISGIGISRTVNFISQPNADYNECDVEIDKIFPDAVYRKPSVLLDEDGTFNEAYGIDDPSGASITFFLKRAPGREERLSAPTDSQDIKETIHQQYTPTGRSLEDMLIKEGLIV